MFGSTLSMQPKGNIHAILNKLPQEILHIQNINLHHHTTQNRFDKLILSLLEQNPDVICLQEVTNPFAFALRSSSVLSSRYTCSPNYVGPYGLLILAKNQLFPLFKEVSFHENSNMGRSLLIAELHPTDTSLNYLKGGAVGTVHLESLNFPRKRRSQLEACNSALGGYSNAILCGDFNFDDTQTWGDWRKSRLNAFKTNHNNNGAADEGLLLARVTSPEELENNVLQEVLPAYRDQWSVLRPNERGATFDGKTNPACVQDCNEVMRYDRVMLKEGSSWVGSRIEMLGVEEMNDWKLKPSDHYGLVFDCICD
jgi:tyrosyl-DNA phosphodiesterase 2